MGHSTSAEVKKQQIEGEDLCRNMLALRYGKDVHSLEQQKKKGMFI